MNNAIDVNNVNYVNYVNYVIDVNSVLIYLH